MNPTIVDNKSNSKDNQDSSFYISTEGEYIKINKRDLVWNRTNDHEHHYLPDFSDETDEYVALSCAKPGCIHGLLHQKKGEEFMAWLNKRRAQK